MGSGAGNRKLQLPEGVAAKVPDAGVVKPDGKGSFASDLT